MLDAATIQASVDGFGAVFAGPSFWFLCVGVVLGGLVGILPGLGGAATLALLLPFVFDQPAQHAFALLIGVISVSATTGDLTSILVGVPGESTAAATVVDGHAMTRRGEAGVAVGVSLASSFVGALIGALTLGVAIVALRPLIGLIGSPELFMLTVVGVCCAMPLAGRSRLRGLAAGAVGLFVATVGLDPISGTPRFTLGQLALWDGVGLIPAALGLFAIPEIVALAGRGSIAPTNGALSAARDFGAGVRAAVRHWSVVIRSSVIGTAIGLLPGLGASTSQWLAYAYAAQRAPQGQRFGAGAIEGVIAPSAANNATLGGALVPMLTLGIPSSLSAAMLLSALILKGLVPGAAMLSPERDGGHLTFVFSLAWMMVVANALAALLTWIGIRWLVGVTQVRSSLLVPLLIVLMCIGAFAERNLVADLVITLAFGIVGLVLVHFDWPRSPLLIGLVLGPLAESRFFLSLQAHGWSWLLRPGVFLIALLVVATIAVPAVRRREGDDNAVTDVGPQGEWVLAAVLLGACVAGLAATFTYAVDAALFPRVALCAASVLLTLLLVHTYRTGGVPQAFEIGAVQTALVVPLFVLIIWALGFTWGATLGVLAHLGIQERERPLLVLSLTAAVYVLLDVVMARMLHVPFPTGAVLEGARALVGR